MAAESDADELSRVGEAFATGSLSQRSIFIGVSRASMGAPGSISSWMKEITLTLDAVAQGKNASEDLLPLVYEELRRLAVMRMAQEAPGQTLQPTALVHEAWLQLAGAGERSWQNRAHFFGAAADAMRRIMIDKARRKARIKHGGGKLRVNLEDTYLAETTPDDNVILINEALQQLEQDDPEQARVVVQKFFGGLSNREVAEKREAELRQQAEAKEQINQAAIYVSQNNFEAANAILDHIKTLPTRPSYDGGMAYRRVGEWLAQRHRWAEAADRFSALMEIDKLDDWNVVTLDYQACGALLAESGQRERYNLFCQAAISRFGTATNGDIAGRILKTCLLFPPDRALMDKLRPMAQVTDRVFRPFPAGRFPPWAVVFLAMWDYRCGNYAAVDDWLGRVNRQSGEADVLQATLQIIQAMTDYRQGRAAQAADELAPARQVIEARFKEDVLSGYRQAYWHDWVFAQILLREAIAMIGPPESVVSGGAAAN